MLDHFDDDGFGDKLCAFDPLHLTQVDQEHIALAEALTSVNFRKEVLVFDCDVVCGLASLTRHLLRCLNVRASIWRSIRAVVSDTTSARVRGSA